MIKENKIHKSIISNDFLSIQTKEVSFSNSQINKENEDYLEKLQEERDNLKRECNKIKSSIETMKILVSICQSLVDSTSTFDSNEIAPELYNFNNL